MSGQVAERLRMYRNPLRMFGSAGPWLATGYLASYLPVGTGLFVAAFVVLVTSSVLTITWLGLPLLVGAAVFIRGCALVERGRSRLVGPPIPDDYRTIDGTGLIRQLRARWADPATGRDCVYLILLFLPLLLLDSAMLIIWLTVLAGITVPIWYWSVPQTWPDGTVGHGLQLGYLPHGPNGPGGFGLWIDNLPTALLAAVGFLILALPVSYLVVLTARVHRATARSLLGPYVDPLAAAKRMLAEPGPLIP